MKYYLQLAVDVITIAYGMAWFLILPLVPLLAMFGVIALVAYAVVGASGLWITATLAVVIITLAMLDHRLWQTMRDSHVYEVIFGWGFLLSPIIVLLALVWLIIFAIFSAITAWIVVGTLVVIFAGCCVYAELC